MQVRRYDAASPSLDKAELLPNGFLRAPAFLTRTGVFEYRLDDGSVRRELRLPEEVFHADALASFALAPITDDHPAEGLVTAANAKALSVGHIGEGVKQDGDRVRSLAMITDAAVVEKVRGGKVQLSCGYVCDLEEKPGEWNGQRYDAIQRGIRGNHVALVDVARAGPSARLKLDSGAGVSIRADRQQDPGPGDAHEPKETQHMVKITVDGIEVEVANDQAAQLIQRALNARGEKLDAAQKATAEATAKVEKATARADEAEAKAKKLEQERADAADPKKVAELVNARVALVSKAREVLGGEAKLDEMDAPAIKRAVLAKLHPDLKLDGKSADYLDARFDAALEGASKDALAALRVAAEKGGERNDGTQTDAEKARAQARKDAEEAWKRPLTATKA